MTMLRDDKKRALTSTNRKKMRDAKFLLWAQASAWQPTRVAVVAGLDVDALTFARMTLIGDRMDLPRSTVAALALATYGNKLAQLQPFTHENPEIEAWLNSSVDLNIYKEKGVRKRQL